MVLKKKSGPAKTWDLTVNNYTKKDIELLERWCPEVNRMVVAKEEGKKETPHLQGRMTFKRAYRFAGLKKLSPDRFHWEITECTQDSLYCMKWDGDVIIDVDNRKQGKRSDLDNMKAMIDKGCTKLELWDANFESMARYYRGTYEYRMLKRAKMQRPECVVEVYFGKSGSGKSKTVWNKYGTDAYYLQPDLKGALWWDGYDGEDVVILNDFRSHWMEYDSMLNLCEWYNKFRLNTKGGTDWLVSTKFVITCVQHPREWYVGKWDHQLERRIHHIYEVSNVENVVTVTEVTRR